MPLERFVLNMEEEGEWLMDDFGPESLAKILNARMKPGQYYVANSRPVTDNQAIVRFERYLSQLRQFKLDVGKGEDYAFGYRMPVPNKGETERKLIIFRRK